MFGKLEEYTEKEFCENNPYFYIYKPDGKVATYQVFASEVVTDTSAIYTLTYNSDEDFLSYLKEIKRESNYETAAELNEDSQIVSLSTCTRASDEHRFVVHGVLVRETAMKGAKQADEGKSK